MHKVKSSFFTRLGQFEKGKMTEAVGIAVEALIKDGIFELTIGKNETVIYFRDTKELRKDAKKTEWVNPKGKRVLIIPLFEFHKKESGQKPLF